jgi:hypothetical protein
MDPYNTLDSYTPPKPAVPCDVVEFELVQPDRPLEEAILRNLRGEDRVLAQ